MIKRLFGRWFGRQNEQNREVWPSIVMLLSRPYGLSDENLLGYANKCWGAATEGEHPRILVTQESCRILQVWKFQIFVHDAAQRYDVEGLETNVMRQKCWDDHSAYLAVELPKAATNVARATWPEVYKLLILLPHALWDDRCLGLYFPAEGVTMPNLGNIVSSIRWSRANGVDMPFLRTKKSEGDPAATKEKK